jgi:hypothetical protein
MTIAAVLLLHLLTLTACATRAPVVQAPVIERAAGASEVANGPTAEPEAAAKCSAKLVGGPIEKTPPSCYVDPHIREHAGLLTYPCSGDGPAEASFGEHQYKGHMTRGEVELVHESELEWEDDHCRWGIRAIIQGNVLTSLGATNGLSWTYRDHVVRGTACSGVSNGKAILQVVRMAPADADDDDDVVGDEDD